MCIPHKNCLKSFKYIQICVQNIHGIQNFYKNLYTIKSLNKRIIYVANYENNNNEIRLEYSCGWFSFEIYTFLALLLSNTHGHKLKKKNFGRMQT